MSKIEIDDSILLKIDYSLRKALYLLRDKQNIEVDSVIDDLSDAVCRISEQVRKIKEGE